MSNIKRKVYLHRSKDCNSDDWDAWGLPEGDAKDKFLYVLSEIELTVRVNTDTGNCKIIEVDGKKLK